MIDHSVDLQISMGLILFEFIPYNNFIFCKIPWVVKSSNHIPDTILMNPYSAPGCWKFCRKDDISIEFPQ